MHIEHVLIPSLSYNNSTFQTSVAPQYHGPTVSTKMGVKVKRKQPVYKYNDFKDLTSETASKYIEKARKKFLEKGLHA